MMSEDEARAAMQHVMDKHPNLTAEGFDAYWPAKMPADRQVKFDADRAKLLESDTLAAFVRAIEWLSQFDARKSFNQHGTSGSLKSVAEPEIGTVAHGAFIAAAVAAGFDARQEGFSKNALLKICRQAWQHRVLMKDHERLAAAVRRAHSAVEEIEAILRADPIASWPYFRRVNAVRRAISSLRTALSEPRGQRAIGWLLASLYATRERPAQAPAGPPWSSE